MRAQDEILGMLCQKREFRRDGISSRCRASGTRSQLNVSQDFVLGCHISALRAYDGATFRPPGDHARPEPDSA